MKSKLKLATCLVLIALSCYAADKFISQYANNPTPPGTREVLLDDGSGNYDQSTLTQILSPVTNTTTLGAQGVATQGGNNAFTGANSFAGATTITNPTLNLISLTKSNSVVTAINALDFGADPTGGSDTTTACQNALNAAASGIGGKTVFFPATANFYNVPGTLTVPSGVTVLGQASPHSGAGTKFWHSSSATPLFSLSSVNGGRQVLANLSMWANAPTDGGTAVSAIGCTDSEMHNLYANGFGIGYLFSNSWDWELVCVNSEGCGDGIVLSNTVNYVTMRGNIHTGNTRTGIRVAGENCNGITVDGSVIESNPVGFYCTNSPSLGAYRVDVLHSRFEANGNQIFLDGGGDKIRGASVSGCIFATGGTNIYANNVSRLLISKNSFNGAIPAWIAKGASGGLVAVENYYESGASTSNLVSSSVIIQDDISAFSGQTTFSGPTTVSNVQFLNPIVITNISGSWSIYQVTSNATIDSTMLTNGGGGWTTNVVIRTASGLGGLVSSVATNSGGSRVAFLADVGSGSASNAVSTILSNGVSIATGVTNLNFINGRVTNNPAASGTVDVAFPSTGSSGTGIGTICGGVGAFNIFGTTARYYPLGGLVGTAPTTVEANMSMAMPAGTFTNLYIRAVALGSGTNMTVTLMTNGVASNLSASAGSSGATGTIGVNTTASVTIPDQCTISLKMIGDNPTVANANLQLSWAVQFKP